MGFEPVFFNGKARTLNTRLRLLGTSLILFTGSAWAVTTPSTSVTDTRTVAPQLLDQLTASYFGVFSGPSLGSLSYYQPDDQGHILEAPANRVVLRNSLSLGYKVTPDVVAGVIGNFNYYPVPVFSGNSFEIADPSLRLSHGKLIQQGNFNLGADLRALIPATQRTRDRNIVTSIRAMQSSTYQVPETQFSLGAYSFAKAYIYGQGAPEDSMNLEAYLAPFVSYQFSNTVTMNLTYEMNAMHRRNQSITSWSSKDPTDLNLGLSMNLTPTVNFNPWIEIFPGGKINLDATQLGAYLSARLL